MIKISKFWTLPVQDRRFFAEAAVLLFICTILIKFVQFKHVHRFLGRHWGSNSVADPSDKPKARLIRSSVLRAARVLPLKTLCLSRSMATFMMLRRRGIPAVLVAGVKLEGSALVAHAWVQVSGEPINERAESATYTTLMKIGLSEQRPADLE